MAIQRPDGPLVQAMLGAGLRVVVVTPRQVKALRSRYWAAGANSDPGEHGGAVRLLTTQA